MSVIRTSTFVYITVSDICTFSRLKEHYKTNHVASTNLFNTDTRPTAVQQLYEAAAKTPIPLMRQMDRWRRDGHRSSKFFVCTPVLGERRKKIRTRVDIDIETRMPAALDDLRRWTSAEALGDVTIGPNCPNRIVPNVTYSDGNVTDGTIHSDDEAIDYKLPSPEEQLQVIALKFPAEIVAVDVSGKAFNRMSIQRRSVLRGDPNRTEGDTIRLRTRTRKPRSRRRNTLAGTDQKEIQDAIVAGEETLEQPDAESKSETGCVFRSKSSEPLRASKKDSSLEKKSHFSSLKQWGKNRLKILNKSDSSKSPPKCEDGDVNVYETITLKRKRSLREKKIVHERNNSCSSSEKSSINLPITTPLANLAVKLRESSVQRRLRRSGGNKDEPHSSSGNWSASSESGRASIGSEITGTTQPKSTTSAATSSNSLNAHPPSSVNSKRKFNINTSGSSSITSEGTLTPDIHDFHEDGETSSVYSCDTEGYYTSFHMDSGLKTLKEEDMPVTPLHSTSAFSNTSSINTILTAENEYELFGKGSTSTTASSAGTVCTTLIATGSNKSLALAPAVPERKSSLTKTNDNSPGSSLEREFGSDKTGTVKRSPASGSKSTVIALIHQQNNGDISPDSGHNTSSSPIESANSPNGVRSCSEFEFSECSDMEGADRIERIRVKTTINSSRIPSMCVITPPHSDDDEDQIGKPQTFRPLETDLDKLPFADTEEEPTRMMIINVNPESGYATVETKNILNAQISDLTKALSSVRAASPSGGTVVIKEEVTKPSHQPIFKASLLPLNNVLGKLKSNIVNFSKRDKICLKNVDVIDGFADESGDYVTIADIKNNNEKVPIYAETIPPPAEYVSLNEISSDAGDSLERKRRQGARVTLNAEGKVVYTSDSLRRRKGAHTTFEPGPYVKESQVPSESPVPAHRNLKCVRPVQSQDNLRSLSPPLGRVVIKATSPTPEIVRVPPTTIVTPTIRPISPKPINSRGAYVHMQDARGSLSPSYEKDSVYSPANQPTASNKWAMENPIHRTIDTDSYGYHNPLLDTNLYWKGNDTYHTLPNKKSQYISSNLKLERPTTPDIMRGHVNHKHPNLHQTLPNRQYLVKKLGMPVQLPQVTDVSMEYKPQVPSLSHFDTLGNDSLKISPIDPRNLGGGFQSSTPSSKSRNDLKAAVNLEQKLLSPKKSTMSTDELYAVIHKGKKKMNISTVDNRIDSPTLTPKRCKSPDTKVKSPETGYLGEKTRSRFSWSPSDGEFVEYNTNIDKLSPERQNGTCNNRKGTPQTSRLDFKKLLLQHSTKTNVASVHTKKLSAVEQLKLSKHSPQPLQTDLKILELSASPKTLQNRRFTSSSPSSPKHFGEKQKCMPKLMSPKSQWRFTNPRTDVLSSTIPEDCGEDETGNSSTLRRNLADFRSGTVLKSTQNFTDANCTKPSNVPTVAQRIRAQRARFFSSPQSTSTKDSAKENKAVLPSSTLETAF
ncbi:uncharacterized protein LOC116165717 [Photinus pyralis]|uniref:uncharacterized protein LOC116165717 n=1 Tax=Photinus pyralis TaxID=7054 RepID=UPI00126762D9|nr:uncharacterized protein LOC116165717 [Photinus pyralis]